MKVDYGGQYLLINQSVLRNQINRSIIYMEIQSKPYNRPKTGFIEYYKEIRKSNNVVIRSYGNEKPYRFVRVWENAFGGGASEDCIYPEEVDIESGTIVISEEDYQRIYSVAKRIKRREYDRKRRKVLKLQKKAQDEVEERNRQIRAELERRSKLQAVHLVNNEGDGSYLILDTETVGLPNYELPAFYYPDKWPSIVSIAWILADSCGQVIEKANYILKPESELWGAVDIHGITYERAKKEGVDRKTVYVELSRVLQETKFIVAHNSAFDNGVLEADLIRTHFYETADILARIPWVCTKVNSVEYVAIPYNEGEYKWPNLQELYHKIFNRNFEGGHDAMVDAEILFKCFFNLLDLGVIDPKKHYDKFDLYKFSL